LKAFVLRAPYGIESLAIAEVPRPGALGPGQVRVAVRAASINYRDLLFVKNVLNRGGNEIPGSDGAGEVIEAAPDVWRVKVGDRVALTFHPDWLAGEWQMSPNAGGRGGTIPGVLCEEVVVHQQEAVVLPSYMSFAEGAALPCAAVTAWHALCAAKPLQPGMTVLLQGAGGVSVFALQFAKLFGARVIMTTSSAERAQRLKQLGAHETVDYRAVPEWQTAVRELTSGRGADLTIEVGGAQTINQSLAATRMGGRLALVGMLTGVPNVTSSMFSAGVDITPGRVGSRADLEALIRAIAFHQVHPVIDTTYPFAKLAEALQHLQSGQHIGKIAIEF
jgi:NADPH:quinone reductase-like Zn-dependent oxidoreductase